MMELQMVVPAAELVAAVLMVVSEEMVKKVATVGIGLVAEHNRLVVPVDQHQQYQELLVV